MVFIHKKIILLACFIMFCAVFAHAQQAIVPVQTDDALPIAPMRYDDAVEIPENNFTSASKNDVWEKYERGELKQDAYTKLQDEYNEMAAKDPHLKNSPMRKSVLREIASTKKKNTKLHKKVGKEKSSPKPHSAIAKKTKKQKTINKKLVSKTKFKNKKRIPASVHKSRKIPNKKKK